MGEGSERGDREITNGTNLILLSSVTATNFGGIIRGKCVQKQKEHRRPHERWFRIGIVILLFLCRGWKGNKQGWITSNLETFGHNERGEEVIRA